jgi:hypothetical protein
LSRGIQATIAFTACREMSFILESSRLRQGAPHRHAAKANTTSKPAIGAPCNSYLIGNLCEASEKAHPKE